MDCHELNFLDVPTLLINGDAEAEDAFEMPLGCGCGWSQWIVVRDPTVEKIHMALERAAADHSQAVQADADCPSSQGTTDSVTGGWWP